MSRPSSRRPSRGLSLEALELRAVPAALPMHMILPDFGLNAGRTVVSSALLADGTLRLVGYTSISNPPRDVHPFPTPETTEQRPMIWDISPSGDLIKQTELLLPAGHTAAYLSHISPDGQWVAGAAYVPVNGRDGGFFDPFVWNLADPAAPHSIELELSATLKPFDIYDVANNGDAVFSARGDDGKTWVAMLWDPSGQTTRLSSVYFADPNANYQELNSFAGFVSADGRIVAGTSGEHDETRRATFWQSPDFTPQELPDLDGPGEVHTISDDGRLLGGQVTTAGRTAPYEAAVWSDGVLTVLHDEQGQLAFGDVEAVVNGIHGDPHLWAALGSTGQRLSIAFATDGESKPLAQWLQREYGLDLAGGHHIIGAFLRDDDLYLLTSEVLVDPAPNTYIGQLDVHLIVVPLSDGHDFSASLDVNLDGHISPADALVLINAINDQLAKGINDGTLPPAASSIRLDINRDGRLTSVDVLMVINQLDDAATSSADASTTSNTPAAEGESSAADVGDLSALAADEFFLTLATTRRK